MHISFPFSKVLSIIVVILFFLYCCCLFLKHTLCEIRSSSATRTYTRGRWQPRYFCNLSVCCFFYFPSFFFHPNIPRHPPLIFCLLSSSLLLLYLLLLLFFLFWLFEALRLQSTGTPWSSHGNHIAYGKLFVRLPFGAKSYLLAIF